MQVTLDEANKVAQGAIAKAEELGIRINVAVCDGGGRLVAFQRMTHAAWAGSFASQGKAMASAAWGLPGGDLTERADRPVARGIVAAEGGHMMLGQGGVPIIRDEVVVGACGVAGGTGEEDEICARAGVDVL